ncbi:phosphodiesterase [Aurantimonas aggregata]|uniref:Phosphodiesterase n=1 Tax=Aurantimonas aggregata TaxID=2047720 RepID=A0A6L9MKG8_9HYPH|nr:phosphodiesterase [Aurantimonas aggregata]NDV88245.1 phosphodiesterase [Aurantimonas aggregata]
MLIAHISDPHVRPAGELAYGVSETNVYLEHAVHALSRLDPQPDCVIVTGDLTDCGLDAEYAIVAGLLSGLPVPVYCVPGNHDRREPFRAAFAGAGYLPATGELNYVVDRGELRIVALDSLVPGENHGALSPATLDFLAAALADAPDRPTLVMLHHPPFDTGIGHMDKNGLREGREALEALVGRHAQVERVLCGHVHRSIQRRFGGTICQIAPSVGHQVAFDLRDGGPSAFVLEPPAFMVHSLHGRSIVSHTVPVDRAPGPFPFVLPDDYPGRQG